LNKTQATIGGRAIPLRNESGLDSATLSLALLGLGDDVVPAKTIQSH
jgi:hypothetical protein